jgi:hypothetical protein
MVRSVDATSGAMAAIDPLALSGAELPSGVTAASGGGPSQGPSTLASIPRLLSIRANASTWTWTPPGTVKL